MAPVAINPARLQGPWVEGYVLDRHTISSIPTGDPYYPCETKRTELGELLFQFKYRNKLEAMGGIVDTRGYSRRIHKKPLERIAEIGLCCASTSI
jgi:hypothetical protein